LRERARKKANSPAVDAAATSVKTSRTSTMLYILTARRSRAR
jgi:hypothetical protein